MRRLLQLGTFLLLVITLAVPISEYFDRWDAPGLTHDTEFAVFCLILALCLVLLVSRLISTLAKLITLLANPHTQSPPQTSASAAISSLKIFLPPRTAPPLRI